MRLSNVLLLTVVVLSACATAATERTMRILQVPLAEESRLKDCEPLGEVSGYSGHGGWLGREMGKEDATNSALSKAADKGATHVLWIYESAGMGVKKKARAYRCK